MLKLFVIHFQALEKYPPVMNLLNFLSRESSGNVSIHVISTLPVDRKLFSASGVQIHRVAKWNTRNHLTARLRLYIKFNLRALRLLQKHRPEKVMYYETLSAGPAIFYRKFINPDSELFIHYHEYASPEEIKKGMVLNRWLHRLELSAYSEAAWVSHTNHDRAALFMRDAGKNAPEKVEVIANYPPGEWIIKSRRDDFGKGRIKFVYVGALSFETTYIKEWAEFISRFPDQYSFTVYSDNYSSDVVQWLESLAAGNISFKGAVLYEQLPEALSQYHAGVILYKGHIPNYIHNAPNKLFEYLACGLDVLFPHVMTGCQPYVTTDTYPVVAPYNFGTPDETSLSKALSHDNKIFKPSGFHYERNLPKLTGMLLNKFKPNEVHP